MSYKVVKQKQRLDSSAFSCLMRLQIDGMPWSIRGHSNTDIDFSFSFFLQITPHSKVQTRDSALRVQKLEKSLRWHTVIFSGRPIKQNPG